MAEVECFFYFSSPWTYFAFESLLHVQQEIGVTIEWRPFLVGGVFNAVNDRIYKDRENPVPAKAACRALGLPVGQCRLPNPPSPDSLDQLAHAVVSGVGRRHPTHQSVA